MEIPKPGKTVFILRGGPGYGDLIDKFDRDRLVQKRYNSGVSTYPPSAAYMRQWTRSTMVQVMAWCLFSAKPLPESVLDYCQLDPSEQISVES